MNYLTEALKADHDRSAFSCGNLSLDQYLKIQARQDMKKRLCAVFIFSKDNKKVVGYYTLSSNAIDRKLVPDEIIKKMPLRYNDLPVTLIGRLAVDEKYQDQKIGQKILIDALKRCVDVSQSQIGSMAVIVDPIDKLATSFYRQYGFIELPDRKRMFLPMKTIEKLFKP